MSFILRVGVHANNPSLVVLSQNGLLEQRVSGHGAGVEWLRIAAGARTVARSLHVDTRRAGSIDQQRARHNRNGYIVGHKMNCRHRLLVPLRYSIGHRANAFQFG